MRLLAPAGTPVPFFRAGASMLGGAFSPGAYQALRTGLAALSGRSRCWLYGTGRAAMVVALRAMRETAVAPTRREVIIPAYTCYSVPAAVVRAGLVPRLCDVSPATLSFDLDALRRFDTSHAVAIVSSNLYGLPNELDRIEAFARERGLLMLDDAAQAMGATLHGRPAGGFGDIGLYSFDKGKNITSMEGGALTADDPALAAAVERINQDLPPASARHALITGGKLLAYSLALRPRIYGWVARVPALGLGRTPYDDGFPVAHYSSALAGASRLLLGRLPQLTAARTHNAMQLREALAGCPGLRLAEILPGASPAHVRLPVFATTSAARDAMIKALLAAGIGATASYPCALNQVPEVGPMLPASDLRQPGAERVAATILTLPTHAYVPPDTGSRIRRILERL
jgi:perosamine synthetase